MSDLLMDFAWRLTRIGYGEYIKSFNPLSLGGARWLRAQVEPPPRLRAVTAALLCGTPVERHAFEDELGMSAAGLIQNGLLDEDAGVVVTSGIVLLQVAGYWLFVSRPQPNTLLYAGDDSVGLFLRQSVRPGGTCLDLCSGPGLQALGASALAVRVDAVEVNPVAMAIARVNVAMNGLSGRVNVHLGGLYGPVEGVVYDSVVANPPFIPIPDQIDYPFVGHGGSDGLRVVAGILDGLPMALAPEGVAQVICALPSDGRRLSHTTEERLAAWCARSGFELRVTITCHMSMQPGAFFFEGLVGTALAAHGGDQARLRAELAYAYGNTGTSHIAACFLHATRGDSERGKLLVHCVAHSQGSLWFV